MALWEQYKKWNSKLDDVGEGEQEITALTPDRMDVDLRFVRPFEGTAKAANIFKSISENQTQITNEFYSNSPYPFNLMFYLFGKKMMTEAQTKNLKNIKQILEKYKLMSKDKASLLMIGLLIFVIVFHLLVITHIIPYTIVWAGKLNSMEEMYVFESISISINLLLIGILAIKRTHIKKHISHKLLNGILWFFVIVFALNTLGNLNVQNIIGKSIIYTAYAYFIHSPLDNCKTRINQQTINL